MLAVLGSSSSTAVLPVAWVGVVGGKTSDADGAECTKQAGNISGVERVETITAR